MISLTVICLTAGPILVLAGLLLWKRPPKTINPVYGYRSTRSMADQESWEFAQIRAGQEFFRSGLALTASAALGLLFDWPQVLGVAVGLALVVPAVVVPIVRTERALKRR